MKRSMIYGGLAAACLAGAALPAQAVPVFTYTKQDRSASAFAETVVETPGASNLTDSKSETAPDFGPFNVSLTALPAVPPLLSTDGTGTAAATQNSMLGPNSIDISTSAFSNEIEAFDGHSFGNASSIAKVNFTVNAATTYTLTGSLKIEEDVPDGLNEVIAEITGPGGTAVLPRIDVNRGNQSGNGGTAEFSQDINQSGMLQPGQYTLDVESVSFGIEGVTSAADLHLSAAAGPTPVPLPPAAYASLPLLGGLALFPLIRRRRGGAI